MRGETLKFVFHVAK